MENTPNLTDLCSISKSIYDRSELRMVHILQCIVGFVALTPNLITLTLLWRVKALHANLRLILANLTCNLLIYSTSMTVKAVYRLMGDPCTFPMPLRPCMIQDWTIIIPLHNALISVLILSLERLYATIRYRSYDYAGSIPYLGTFLIAMAWATTLGLNVPAYFKISPDYWTYLCDIALIGNRHDVTPVIVTMFAFESVAAILTTLVFVYNRYLHKHMAINRALYNLSARFQVNQNVQLNKALMPGMLVHMTCYLPNYIFLAVLARLENDVQVETRAWLWHLTFLWRMMYALLDPILLLTLNRTLRQAFAKSKPGKVLIFIYAWFGKRNDRTVHDANTKSVQVMNAHFDYLYNTWNAKS